MSGHAAKSENGNSAFVRRSNKKHYKFYLPKPFDNTNANLLAKQLIAIKNVEEVLITDGDYGFMVKTNLPEGKGKDEALDYISKKLGASFSEVISHYQYIK